MRPSPIQGFDPHLERAPLCVDAHTVGELLRRRRHSAQHDVGAATQ